MLKKMCALILGIVILPSLAAGQTVSFIDADGNAATTYLESSTAYVQVNDAAANLNPGAADTVQAQLTSLLAGDIETLTLTETGDATGIFEGSIELYLGLATAENGIFDTNEDAGPPPAFDTLTAAYGLASANAGTLGSRAWLIDAEGEITTTYPTGSTVYVRLEDHNFNNPYSDYLYVELSTSNGDMMSTFIFETGADTAIFEGSVELEHTTYIDTYDDKLQAVTGEQVTLTHLDYWGYTSSTANATLIVGELDFIDQAGDLTTQLAEGDDARLRLFSAGDNANPATAETVTASLASQFTGDAESLVLTETGADTDVFEGSLELANDSPLSGNGVLETGNSGWPDFLPDQVTAQVATLGAAATTTPSATHFIDLYGGNTETFVAGETLYLRAVDHHLNDPLQIDFTGVTVNALGSGDSEYLMLTETSLDTGVFEGSMQLGSGGFSGDGTLDASVGETIEASRDHTSTPGASTDQATIIGSRTLFVDDAGQPATISLRGLPVNVRVIDHSANTDPLVAETASVALDSRITGDLESLTLPETGADTGIFEGSILTRFDSMTAGNGVLETRGEIGPPVQLDTLSATYTDASGQSTATIESLGSQIFFVDAAGEVTTSYATGSTAYVRLVAHDLDSTSLPDPTSASISIAISGEYEDINLTETGPTTGIFEGSIPLQDSATPSNYNGLVETQAGDELNVTFSGYDYVVAEATAQIVLATIELLDDTGQPAEELFEGGTFGVRVFSASDNLDPGLTDTLQVNLDTLYGGDAEALLLTETGADTNLFEGMMSLNFAPAGPSVGDGVLDTSTSGPPEELPDVITVSYGGVDDTATAVGSRTTLLDNGGQDIEIIRVDAVAHVRVIDLSLNDPQAIDLAQATVSATVYGDSETISLTETGLDTGVFEGSIQLGISYTIGDGILEVSHNEIMEAVHYHHMGLGSSSDQVTGKLWPGVSILEPYDQASFLSSDSIYFWGFAQDLDEGDLASSLTWTSDLDGAIGTGGSFYASLSTGTHVITAQVTNSIGLSGNESRTIHVDNTPPTASITAPANGAMFNAGDPVLFTGSANDHDDGDLTANLSWSSNIDGVIGNGGSFSTAALSSGAHVITAQVTDSGGAPASDTIALTVNTAPSVAVTAPVDGVSVNVGDSVSFTGSANDSEDGDLTASLSWSSDVDGVIGTGGSFQTSALAAGVHVITARVTDTGGLQGSSSITLTVNAAPSASITAPADGATFNVGDSISFTGSASDALDGDLTASLAWSSDVDGAIGTGGSFSISSLSAGAHVITARVTDSGGLEDTDAVTLTINTAPSASITAPADGAAFNVGDSVSFTGSANDPEDGDVTASLAWSSDIDGAIGTGGSFATAALSAGTHAITASVTDAGGLEGSDTITITVNAAPSASITAPADGASFSIGDSVTFTGSASDPEDGDITANIAWTSDRDGAIGNGGSFATAALSAGTHVVTASVTDAGGLSDSDGITITVNATPSVNISAPTDGAGFNTGDNVSFTGAASDPEDGDITASIAWTSDRDGAIGTGGSFATAALSAGAHVITASVTDAGGLQDSDAITITVNAAPSASITAPADGSSFLATDSIGFAGSASDTEDGDLTASLAWTSNLDGAIGTGGSFTTNLSVGIHLITANVTDAGGLQDADSITVTVQNTAPSVTITAPTDGTAINVGDNLAFTGSATDFEDGDLTANLAWSSSLDGAIGSGGSFSTAGLTAGTHVITASVTDAGGLSDADAITITVNGAPSATITAPADGSSFLATDSIGFAGSASDTEDGDLTASLAWTSNLDGAIGAGGSLTTSLSVGTHLITASVTDAGGLQGTDSITVTVQNTAPSVTISAPPGGTSVNVGTSIGFVGSATDFEDGDLTASLAWSSSLDGAIGSGGSFSTAGLSAGTHAITASVTDAGGLQGSDGVTITVNANVAPTVTITAPADGSTATQGDSLSFAGTASDPEQGDLSASLAWSSSLDGAIGSGASFSTSALSVGSHTITASVTDAGGLSDADAITVTVLVPPVQVTFTSISTEDGWVRESNENSDVGGRKNNTGTGTSALRPGDDKKDKQYKALVSFDTSSLPAGATIVSATLRMRRGNVTGTNPFTTHGTCWVDVETGGFAGSTTLANGDFEAAATAVQATSLSNAVSNGDWSEGTLNAAGLSAIHTSGTTQMRIYFDLDDNDDAGNDYIGYYSGDNSNASNHPQLVVVYQP